MGMKNTNGDKTKQLINMDLWKIISHNSKMICVNSLYINDIFDILFKNRGELRTKDFDKYYFIVDYNGKYKKYKLEDIADRMVLCDVTIASLKSLFDDGWDDMVFNDFLKNKAYKDMLKHHIKRRRKNGKYKKSR